jgi:hypothetical protein
MHIIDNNLNAFFLTDPIAMSVRSTNVYEEQSLGVYHRDEDDYENEFNHHEGSRMTIWSRYLAMHARKQLSFGEDTYLQIMPNHKLTGLLIDMWWLALALFLLCIIEVCVLSLHDYL